MQKGTVRCLVFFLVRFLPIDVLLTKVAETPTNLVGTRAHYGEIKSRNSLLFSCFQCAPGRSLHDSKSVWGEKAGAKRAGVGGNVEGSETSRDAAHKATRSAGQGQSHLNWGVVTKS